MFYSFIYSCPILLYNGAEKFVMLCYFSALARKSYCYIFRNFYSTFMIDVATLLLYFRSYVVGKCMYKVTILVEWGLT